MLKPITARNLYLRTAYPGEDLDEAESRFFSSIQLPNGTYKETCKGRFDNVNDLVVQYLRNSNTQCDRILDVGVSSGISTMELYDIMLNNGFHVTVTAVDFMIDAFLTTFFPGFHVLADKQGRILQLDIGGFSVGYWYKKIENLKDVIKGVFKLLCESYLQERMRYRISTYPKGIGRKIHDIRLLSRRWPLNHRISFLDHDILIRFPEPYRQAYDYIRAANTLNRSYFPDDAIVLALKNLKECLKGPGSFLCVVRTNEDGQNNGALYALNGDYEFHQMQTIGDGSEIDSLISEAWRNPPTHQRIP